MNSRPTSMAAFRFAARPAAADRADGAGPHAGRARRALASIVLTFALGLGACEPPRRTDARTPAVERLEDPVVAEVGGAPIYLSDVIWSANAEGEGPAPSPGDPAFAAALDELIDRRLLTLEAERRGLDRLPEAQRRLAHAREHALSTLLLEEVLAETVTEAAIRRLYEEQVALLALGEEVRVRHILVATAAEARQIADQLRAGADFAALARARSLDVVSRESGGEIGWLTREGRPAALAAAAFAARVGDISRPVATDLGWHVVEAMERRAESPPTFEAMRPRLVEFLTYQELPALMARVRASVEVRRRPLEGIVQPVGEASAATVAATVADPAGSPAEAAPAEVKTN